MDYIRIIQGIPTSLGQVLEVGSCGIADLRRFADLGSRLFLLFAFVCVGGGGLWIWGGFRVEGLRCRGRLLLFLEFGSSRSMLSQSPRIVIAPMPSFLGTAI